MRSEKARRALLLVASFGTTIGGIGWAVLAHRPEDAGRGGAIAVALTFLSLFLRVDIRESVRSALALRPDIDAVLQDDSTGPASEIDEVSRQRIALLERRLDALETTTRIEAVSIGKMNLALAISPVLGTLVWGFGDCLANALLA